MPGATGSQLRVSPGEATRMAESVLTKHGYSPAHAATIAAHLVEAELIGFPIMGLARLRAMVANAKNTGGEIRVESESRLYTLVDGGGNPGYVSVDLATNIAIETATREGVGLVGIQNSSHAGMAGYYVERAANQGLVAMMFVSSYARVAPFGGIDALLGTNPMAFAFPATPYPVVIDASTSAVSNGQVELARILNGELPDGVAIDPDGELTRDPAVAQEGALLPAAAHKGYGFGLAMQIFGLLVGGDPVPVAFGNQGILLMVLKPEMFGSREQYETRIDNLLTRLRQSRPADGAGQVLIPGEGRAQRRAATIESGIAVPQELLEMVNNL